MNLLNITNYILAGLIAVIAVFYYMEKIQNKILETRIDSVLEDNRKLKVKVLETKIQGNKEVAENEIHEIINSNSSNVPITDGTYSL